MAAERVVSADVKNIETFIDEGGEITIGPIGPVLCGAAAADHHVCPGMPARREGETLNALLKRLDKALARFYSDNVFTDEVNGP